MQLGTGAKDYRRLALSSQVPATAACSCRNSSSTQRMYLIQLLAHGGGLRGVSCYKYNSQTTCSALQAAGGSADGSNYLCPLTPDTAAELERRWAACRAAAGGAAVAETVPVMFGRSIELQADQVTCCCWAVAV